VRKTYSYDSLSLLLTCKIESFTTACRLVADLSQIPKRKVQGKDGETYYDVYYDVILLFGLTELKAHLRWMDGVRAHVGILPHMIFNSFLGRNLESNGSASFCNAAVH